MQKPLKLIRLLARPKFARAVVINRVAAAIEHLDVIKFCAAATLIDAGANKGQFSLAFHVTCPTAKILAFEPLPDAADRFEALFAGDPGVALHRMALSDHAGEAVFHVTDRQDSSSLLKPGAGQREAFGVGTAREIRVPLARLDARVPLGQLAAPVLLKIDVQGAELQVLQGCESLDWVDFIYVELSFVELYEGQPLFDTVSTYLADRGFKVAGIFNQTMTPAFGPTQADVLFRRATS